MAWPQAHDFQDAVLNPQLSFADRDLRAAEVVKDEVIVARAKELEPIVKQAGSDVKKLEDVLYNNALAQTDCEACGWPPP